MGRDTTIELQNELGEDALAALGEQREFSKRRAKVVRLITGLEEAGRIDVERAEFRVKKARAELREAEDDLGRVKETNGHEAEALLELVRLSKQEDDALDEDMRQVGAVLHNLGRTFVDPDLVRPRRMVERRKRLRDSGEISRDEATAI
jgi:histidyl-tRNA synthetase